MNPAKRLENILEEMTSLINEASSLVRRHGTEHQYEAAKCYWIAQIKCALSNDHDYLGGSTLTMRKTIDNMGWTGEDLDEDSEL